MDLPGIYSLSPYSQEEAVAREYLVNERPDAMSCGMCEAHINDVIRRSFDIRSVKSPHKQNKTEIISAAPVDEEKLRKAIAGIENPEQESCTLLRRFAAISCYHRSDGLCLLRRFFPHFR